MSDAEAGLARLDEFARSQRQTQLAELEVRLQPVLGLIETFRQEVKKSL